MKKCDHEDIEDISEESMEIHSPPPIGKHIFLFDEISSATAGMLISALEKADKTPGSITLNIFSGGGSTWAGFAMYDAIKRTSNTVITIGHGLVGSAAVLPLLAGDKRYLNKSCRIFLHEGSMEMSGGNHSLRSMKASYDDSLSLEYEYNEAIASNVGIPQEKVREMCEANVFLSAKQALKLGFADGYLDYKRKKAPPKKAPTKKAQKTSKVRKKSKK